MIDALASLSLRHPPSPACRVPAPGANTYAPNPELAGPGSFQRRVARLVLAQRGPLRWLFMSTLVQSLLGLGGPWLSARAIDTALPNQAPSMLAIIGIMAVLASAHSSLASWLHGRVLIVLRAQVEAACSREALRRFLMTRFAVIAHKSFGETHETLVAVRVVSLAIMGVLIGGVSVLLMTLGVALAMAVWFPALALAATGVCIVMAALASVLAMREAQLAAACLDASGKAQSWLSVVLLSVPTLRASGASTRAMKHWGHLVNASAKVRFERMRSHVAQGVVLEAFPQLLAFGASAWLVWQIMGGTATLGEMMMANMLLGQLTGSVVGIVLAVVGFQALSPQLERVNALFEHADNTPERHAATALSMPRQPRHAVELDGVWFRYAEEGRWVLEGHSQAFPIGQISTLRAASGAGKTTLLRLAAGLLEPQRGSVRVLGLDPCKTSGLVTYLPQQAALLEASIATNLKVFSGRPLADVLQVAEHTGLAGLLRQLPMGVDTLVSVRGGNLSAGQCQLVVLTAAFASGRPVILLDEATSQIDRATRMQIDWGMLTRGKSVIHVTHDD